MEIKGWKIPDYLLYGFAIASIGGPLALVTVNFFSSAYVAGAYSIQALLLGAALFLAPLAIWYNYSKKIASAGGLYTFVEKSVGKKAAALQGWIWLASYFLYLPYTVAFIVYSLLPLAFPSLTPYLPIMEIALPIIITISFLLSFRKVMHFILVTALMQLAIVVAFAYAMLSGSFLHAATYSGPTLLAFAQGTLATSILFVCASLPLFLGGEAEGGSKSIRKALILSFAVVSAVFLLGAFALRNASPQQAGSNLPGYIMATSYLGVGFAEWIALFTIISMVDLIFIEFIAISRLSLHMLGQPLNRTILLVGGLFVLSSAIAMANPEFFYQNTLILSLTALFLSQIIVFAAYPFFAKKQHGKVRFFDVGISIISCFIMLYGLYTILLPYL